MEDLIRHVTNFNGLHSETNLMDNLRYMRQIPDKFFDLVQDDPPYGIGAEQGVDRASRAKFKNEKYGWDSAIPTEEYFYHVKRISHNQIIWGGNYFLDYLGKCRCYIVWDKLNPERLFGDCEMAWTSFDEVPRIYKERRVQELNKLDGGKIHPTQKPVRLYYWTLKKWATAGMKIADFHLGSGSHRIAAHLLGMNFYSTERAKYHYENEQVRFKSYIDGYGFFKPEQNYTETQTGLFLPEKELDLSQSDFTL